MKDFLQYYQDETKKKIKKGSKRGQFRSNKLNRLKPSGSTYYSQPGSVVGTAPSSSTYVSQG